MVRFSNPPQTAISKELLCSNVHSCRSSAAPQSLSAFVFGAEATSDSNGAGTEESTNAAEESWIRRSRKRRLSKTESPRMISSSGVASGQTSIISSIVADSPDRWQTLISNCARGHGELASASEISFGVFERTVARLIPLRCSVRKRRSSIETPHKVTKAPELSAIMTHSWRILLSCTSSSGSSPALLDISLLLRKSQHFLRQLATIPTRW